MSVKRRKFSDKFKAKLRGRLAHLTVAQLMALYKLPSSAREWLKAPSAASETSRPNGLALVKREGGRIEGGFVGSKAIASPVPLEALVYLRHARKAMDLTKRLTKAELLTLLALETLEAK